MTFRLCRKFKNLMVPQNHVHGKHNRFQIIFILALFAFMMC